MEEHVYSVLVGLKRGDGELPFPTPQLPLHSRFLSQDVHRGSPGGGKVRKGMLLRPSTQLLNRDVFLPRWIAVVVGEHVLLVERLFCSAFQTTHP